ncbi:hypothetical protein [Thermochromatium tepidum]|jgi:hypothetical protein|uniref:Uncharacterized protein n=1 Tax=Thermochromatium tepidum ATCC 43061 TaxID=316276 RepID=A0A6I6EE11_THETI|nr:hypothetical protein [Thermochromatium tepidum]QGU32380.1 hypothetical protein E6P07_04865 [Thermochromatium tepidum ATCC 43061]
MTETIRIGGAFFDDLATIPDVKSMLIKDRQLSEDEFALRHAETIRRHYAKVARLEFLQEDAQFFASCIWKYLNSLDSPAAPQRLTGPIQSSDSGWFGPPMTRT